MFSFLVLAICARWVSATLHHMYLGTVDGGSLYLLEMDDAARSLTVSRNGSAAGASPSLVLDRSKLFLFGSRPSDGTVSRYTVDPDYTLHLDGTTNIPESCNTTSFNNIELSSESYSPYYIYGSASTGVCSTLFSFAVTGLRPLRSAEVAGDIRSLAWSPNGRHLHALNSRSNSLLSYNISLDENDPDLQHLLDTSLLVNTTKARQIITHPVGHRLYVVTEDSNELIDIPLSLSDRIAPQTFQNRTAILAKDTPSAEYRTTSLAISSSNNYLWTLSQSKPPNRQFIFTIFRLDPLTGAIVNRVARAAFQNSVGDGTKATSALIAAPFDGDIVAVTTYPGAMVAMVGFDGTNVKSYGRQILSQDVGCCGEGVWID